MSELAFDWADVAFGNKKPLQSLDAIFITAPREMSVRRFTQLIKTYLPQGNILLGLAKEKYVEGLEDQPQFKMLQPRQVQAVIEKVNASASPHKIATLRYFQRELPFVLEKLGAKKALFINGSWQFIFHSRPEFYKLVKLGLSYELLSPFADEAEARAYAAQHQRALPQPNEVMNAEDMLLLAQKVGTFSFDNGFQTGAVLGRKTGKKYQFLTASFNKVVPYQAYAWHYGAAREKHFSPMHDLNHYDTIHAEVGLIIAAQKQGLDLRGSTLFINLLPCPTCARMLAETDIAEVLYRQDHSSGYAVNLLKLAGKKVTRLVPKEGL